MKLISILIIIISMISASVFASHIPNLWLQFIFSLLGMITGIVLLKVKNKQITKKNIENSGHPLKVFEKIITEILEIVKKYNEIVIDTEYLENKLEMYNNQFENIFVSLNEAIGIKKYTILVSIYARGERLLNRALSAALDGYLMEAKENIELAVPILEELIGKINEGFFDRR